MDKITVQIATIKGREESLKVVIQSLLPQVDEIKIMLNNYNVDGMSAELPDWLVNDKIRTVFTDNSIMDGYKFLAADVNKGYVFICDDDIWYPHDFCETMIRHLDKLPPRSVASIMGKNLLPLPIESYANGHHEMFRAFEYHTKYYEVNLIGMCGAVYHSSYCKMNEKSIYVTDSDVCMSAYCHKHGIRKFVVPHFHDWCKDLNHLFPPETNTMWIHNKSDANDKTITDFINWNFGQPDKSYHYPEMGNSFVNDDLA